MRQFEGRGAELHLASEPTKFVATLEDIGDGFDWRTADPSLRHWLADEPLTVEIWDEEWYEIEPVEVHYASGRVGLPRSFPNGAVRAMGTCIPTSRVGTADSWQLEVAAYVNNRTMLGSDERGTDTTVGDSTAVLWGCRIDETFRPYMAGEKVLAVLPAAFGAFIGTGSLTENGLEARVKFDHKGVVHVHR